MEAVSCSCPPVGNKLMAFGNTARIEPDFFPRAHPDMEGHHCHTHGSFKCWLEQVARPSLHRMLLSLQTIGWRADSFSVWHDERGYVIDLLYTSPAMLNTLLQEGVQRSHERRLAQSLTEFSAARVAPGPMRRLLRSKKTSAREKYWMCAAFSGGAWTGDRLKESGYVHDGMCPLGCGMPDTLVHRQWFCSAPAAVEARRAHVSDEIIKQAQSADAADAVLVSPDHPSA